MEYEYLPTPAFHPMRGEIYLCDLGDSTGSIQSGKRPVLIIQEREYNDPSPTVVVAPITSVLKKEELSSHVILLPDISGLAKTSMVLIEQTRTVHVSDLLCYYGHVKDEVINDRLNKGITTVFGIKRAEKEKRRAKKKNFHRYIETTCLCHKCVSFYLLDPHFRVRRLTPHNGFKDICDRCGRSEGFDYQILEEGDK